MRVVSAAALAVCAVVAAGCGAAKAPQNSSQRSQQDSGSSVGSVALHGKPQTIEPVAGAAPSAGESAGPAVVSVGSTSGKLAQPVSNAQVQAQLAASGMTANQNQATLAPGGLAIAPIAAPAAIQSVINAGNQIARLPYRFGGGHGTFEDTEYDCSGSLSFVLAAAGLLNTTVTSGTLMSYGDPGPGKWITIFANPGHTFMYVAGLRFDTVALAQTGSRWSNRSATERDGFVERHPPGM
jgi:hypothetical protein